MSKTEKKIGATKSSFFNVRYMFVLTYRHTKTKLTQAITVIQFKAFRGFRIIGTNFGAISYFGTGKFMFVNALVPLNIYR